LVPDGLHKFIIEHGSRRKTYEEDDAYVPVPILADADGLGDLRKLFDLIIDLGGTDAHPAWIEGRIRAPMDDDAAMLGPLGEVAMAPDILEPVEVGGSILLAFRVIPEPDRHGGKWPGADELALFSAHGLPVIVPDIDRQPKPRSLD